uniref:Uncharacterized protein n=1 Tax=Diadromus pulchellus ascovirus 4a TaxID=158683 RepID=Q9DSU7_9VIRU|nr:hypothetical protein [Diadromus pulchellus ascovirus 4a]
MSASRLAVHSSSSTGAADPTSFGTPCPPRAPRAPSPPTTGWTSSSAAAHRHVHRYLRLLGLRALDYSRLLQVHVHVVFVLLTTAVSFRYTSTSSSSKKALIKNAISELRKSKADRLSLGHVDASFTHCNLDIADNEVSLLPSRDISSSSSFILLFLQVSYVPHRARSLRYCAAVCRSRLMSSMFSAIDAMSSSDTTSNRSN